MAFRSGFFNSKSDRKYFASDFSFLIDSLIIDGVLMHVYDALNIISIENTRTVGVTPGMAWFNHTWSINDSIMILNIDSPDLLFDRIDAVVLEVDGSEAVRANNIKVIKGAPASIPVRPTLINEEPLHQHVLAYITVKKDQEFILADDIELMIGKEETPYATGILSTLDADRLLEQWNAQFLTWFESIQDILDENTAGNLLNLIYQHGAFEYTQTAIDTLIIDGNIKPHGFFKSLFTDTTNAISINGSLYNIKNGVSDTINLNIDTVYNFIIIDDTIHFAAAGGGQILLWENANGPSPFPKQTLSINTSGYDYIEVTYMGESSLRFTRKIDLNPGTLTIASIDGVQPVTDRTSPQVHQIRFFGRRIEINPTSISFFTGVLFRPQYSTLSVPTVVEETNAVCVPLKIYGGNY